MSGRLLPWLWRGYFRQRRVTLAAALGLMAVEGTTMGAISYTMRPMFDRVLVAGDSSYLLRVGIAFLVIFTVRGFAGLAQRVLLARTTHYAAAALRSDLVRHLMTLDGAFHLTHPPGELIQRVQADTTILSDAATLVLTGAGRDAVSLVALLGVALYIDPVWAALACLGAPGLVLPAFAVQRFTRARAREARDLGARLGTRADEVFHGIVPIKLNRIEAHQAGRYDTLSHAYARAEVRASLGTALMTAIMDFMAGVGLIGVIVYGGAEIIAGDKTVGQFMAFFTALGLAFDPLRRLGAMSGAWQMAAAAGERTRALLDARPSILSPAAPRNIPPGPPRIILKDVRLAYDGATVLDGLSLTAEAGRTTALVGPSGAGKTTVFHLLTRLVDPASGSVSLGDTPVSDIALPDLRDMISAVSQDPALFDESLRDNILLGRRDVPDDRLAEVLAAAHVTEFLPNLARGLDTPVGPRGAALSGGQRQRVAIARALLRDTPVLLLDEATSALDAESERYVQEALERLARGRTTLVVAHRLSTVRKADHIVVMDHGRAVDAGRHEELLSRGGLYARLHALQLGETQD